MKLTVYLVALIAISMSVVGCGDETPYQPNSVSDMQERQQEIDRRNNQPENSPAPEPVKPIGGDTGLYGNCHNASC